MVRIGEFAWPCQVTVEALRHYDRIELLKPVRLDPWTGYRHCSLDQLPRLNRILALQDLGLSLKEIARVLEKEVSPDVVRYTLEVRYEELREQIQEAQDRLARVEARLTLIEMEGRMPDYEVLPKTIEGQWIASVRETISSWDRDVVGPTLTGMSEEVATHLLGQGAEWAGPGIALYHGGQTAGQDAESEGLDVEIAASLSGPISGGERVRVGELPAAKVAYAVHQGSFTGLSLAKRAAFSWMEDNGYRRAGPSREVCLHFAPDREANADSPDHITEIQVPVEKA